MSIKIEAIDFYLPKDTLSNEDLKIKFSDFDIDKLGKKIGIQNRHISAKNETSLDLGYLAASKIINHSNKESVDYLLFCTQTPDYFLPTSACILQDKIGLKNSIGALDFNLGCSGFIYGLSMAQGLINSGQAKKVLLITGETYSKLLHEKDKTNQAIFGDAGAACLIEGNVNSKYGKFVFRTNGNGHQDLIVKNGGFRNQLATNNSYEYGSGNITSDDHLYMNGPDIFNFTIEEIPPLVKETLAKNQVQKEEIDFFIFHQANKFMLNFLRKKLGIEKDKFIISMEQVGNTVSNTIPIALKNSIDSGVIQRGHKLCLVGFGVGLSAGATIIEY